MKKLLTFGIACLISFSQGAKADEYCDSRMDNLTFFSAGISENGNVTCTYRYCYYNCIYDSYTIKGKFEPGRGSWEAEGTNAYSCIADSSPRSCPFHRVIDILQGF